MALVDVKAMAFLVGKEGFDPIAPPIVSTSLISIGKIGDQEERVIVLAAPPTDQVQCNCGCLCKTYIVAMEDLSFREWI